MSLIADIVFLVVALMAVWVICCAVSHPWPPHLEDPDDEDK